MRTQRPSGRRGAAAVEFAAVLPFLLFLAVIATDWARLFYHTITVEQAARCGALYAADMVTQFESRYYNADENVAVNNLVRAEAANLDQSKLANPTITRFSGPDGKPMVTVTVEYQFTTLTRFPGVPQNQTLTRQVTMRTFPVTPNPAPN
jgi:Flp pilus assembly protein TadG